MKCCIKSGVRADRSTDLRPMMPIWRLSVGIVLAFWIGVPACTTGVRGLKSGGAEPTATSASGTPALQPRAPSPIERPAQRTAADRAAAAALRTVGAGTVRKVEKGDEGVAYSVEVRRPSGNIVQVLLGSRFQVIGVSNDFHEETGGEEAGA